ncbi:SAP domain-containing ribonucleoprotein-like [Acipenser ruthenus]|uniref:SAP domain-containing ribonucleoprotein-like n=1 Tax=Acipenser ruthenus TaxID=7906 RepID=UPI002741793A|nr:SAP domain-containing ribonucleoprotein-like [Acipenser ruthenus]
MAEVVVLHKLKLAELKQECTARGLETKGNKQELVNRLQAYLEEHAVEEEVNEEEVLGEDTEEEEVKVVVEEPAEPEKVSVAEKEEGGAADKKVVKIASTTSPDEKLQQRAQRFNVPPTGESKKAARAARFGLPAAPEKDSSVVSQPAVNVDQLKKRAQRFGMNVSSVSKKVEEDEKLKKRKERFGILTSAAGATDDIESCKGWVLVWLRPAELSALLFGGTRVVLLSMPPITAAYDG